MNHILHNLRIRTRLLAILVTFLIPVLLLGFELNTRLAQSVDFSVQEMQGAEMEGPLLLLLNRFADYEMSQIQKLDGDTSLDADIKEKGEDADNAFVLLRKLDAQYSKTLDLSPEGLKKHGRPETLTVENLEKQWATIKSSPYNHQNYRKLSEDTVALIAHVGDTSNLILDGDLDTYYLIDTALNVFPVEIESLTDLQQRGYKVLRANNNKFDAKAQDELDNIAVNLEMNYLPHVKESVTRALHEDKNFGSVNETLQKEGAKFLDEYEASGEKMVQSVHALSTKGLEMAPDTYVDMVDVLHNSTSQFAQLVMKELQTMINERVEALYKQRDRTLGLSGLIVLFAFGLFFIVANSISRPIKQMTETMGILSNGDTTVTIPSTENKDEIGDMGRAVLVFKDNMIQTDALRKEQENLKAEAERQKTITMNKMADDFEASVKTVVTGVSASATQMRGNAERLNALADQTKATSASVASSATEAAQTATQVAAAAEELTASIGEISAQVQKSSSVASQATSQAESISQTMHLLVEKSNRVGEVIQFITSIASQINLLALNATIESARAGEAGRGFAVVASEVKNLANQTAKATEEIVQQVQSMQEATQDAVHSVGSIINIISEISASTNGVAAAVEEQSAATNEISRNITHTATGTNEISRDIVTVERGADETGISSRQVLDSAKALTEQSELLNQKVNDFLKTVRAM